MEAMAFLIDVKTLDHRYNSGRGHAYQSPPHKDNYCGRSYQNDHRWGYQQDHQAHYSNRPQNDHGPGQGEKMLQCKMCRYTTITGTGVNKTHYIITEVEAESKVCITKTNHVDKL
jgi:hypothetical protein